MKNKKKLSYILVVLTFFVILCFNVVAVDINCSSLVSDVIIEIDEQPYFNDVNSFLAVLPNEYKTHSVKCWSYVTRDGQLQQVNPQKTSYSKTFFSLPHQVEDREYFTATNGVVNAYFTKKNLVSYTQFILGVKCVSEVNGDTIIGEKCVTPYYQDLRAVSARSVWGVQNMSMLVPIGVAGILLLMVIGVSWRYLKDTFR